MVKILQECDRCLLLYEDLTSTSAIALLGSSTRGSLYSGESRPAFLILSFISATCQRIQYYSYITFIHMEYYCCITVISHSYTWNTSVIFQVYHIYTHGILLLYYSNITFVHLEYNCCITVISHSYTWNIIVILQ